MNRKTIVSFVLVVLFLVSVTPAPSETSSTHYSPSTSIEPPATQWNMTYGGIDNDAAVSVQQTTDGGYIVGGYTNSSGSDDYMLVKTDGNGNMIWNQTYGGGRVDRGYCVRQTTDGGYVIVGQSFSFGINGSFWLVKTDANGNMIWDRTYGGDKNDVGEFVQQTTDGGYIVAGFTRSFGAGGYDFYLVKTDANGNTIWDGTYGGVFTEYAWPVQQTTDGGYMMAGLTYSFGNVNGTADFYLVKTDASGNMIWNQTYGGVRNDAAYSAQQTTDGGYVMAGYTNSSGIEDFWLVKTDASGNMVWDRTYGGANYSSADSIQQTTDGGYITAGTTYTFGNDNGTADFWLIKTDGNGNMIWNQTYGGAENDEAACVQQTTDGGYIVAGYTESFGNDNGTTDFWLVKVAPESRPELDVNTFHEGNTGAFPRNADPAICYDTASAELLFNTMQGLLSCNGEQYYDFVPTLATNIPTRQNTTMVVTNTSTVSIEPTGSTWTNGTSAYTCVGWVDEKQNGFGNGDIVYLTDGTRWCTWTADTVTIFSTVTMSLWRGSYVFNIRTVDSHGKPIKFYGSDGNAVDTFDVMDAAYSFRWAEVLDVPGQPIWMFDKPFFDQLDHTYWTRVTAMDLAHLINDAIVPDTASNTLTLNVGCRFPDNAFKQILSNTWGDILSEEHSIALGGWDGNLFSTAKYGGPFPDWWIDWAAEGAGIDYVNLDPLNKVEAATYVGTGPYHVALVDQENNKVILQKNPGFWMGWPAAGCNGSLNTIEIHYIADWTTRKNEFLAGTIDTCAVPNVNVFEMLDNTTKEPANPQTKTIKNLNPSPLVYNSFLFEFDISEESPYIGTGQFPDGIPLDFFNNAHVRRAFAYSFNWSTYGDQAFYGDYYYRKNWLVEGLYPDYYNNSVPGYYESLSNAEAELKAAVFNGTSVWNSGFSFTVGHQPGNDPQRIAFAMIRDFFTRLSTYDGRDGPSFTVNVAAIPNVLADFRNRLRPICVIGWLVDFPDADDFARPYMYSAWEFALVQGYTAENGWGSTKDVLVDQAVLTVDGPARAALYGELQQMYYDDVPSFPLPVTRIRRWQQYWVKGWYYSPVHYGYTYFYTVWKSDDCWFDVSGPSRGVSDGVVNMRDVAYLVDCFNAKAPIAGQTIYPKWIGVYGANGCVDPSGDRVCNLRDIAGCILHFNHKINTDTP